LSQEFGIKASATGGKVKARAFLRSLTGSVLLSAGVFALRTGVATSPQALGIFFVVDSTGDGDLVGSNTICNDGTGHCTLRAAITASNQHFGIDGIGFNIPTTDPGYNPQTGVYTINLGSALPALTDSVNINGPGATTLTVQRSTVSGTPNFGIFSITGSITVNISGLSIVNGVAALGGGINNYRANLKITGCTLSGNFADDGGGIYNVGGNNLNITGCTFSGNSALLGGGIYNEQPIGSQVNLTLTNSTLSNNTASSAGGGIYSYAPSGTLTLTNTTLSGNVANGTNGANGDGGGGGVFFSGGAGGTLNITNSILINNFAVGSGGGISLLGISTLTNSTLSGNTASNLGGGIYNFGSSPGLTLANSTLSGNAAAEGGGIFNALNGSTLSPRKYHQ
jgi:CSLREA domain-containing protein